MTGQTNDDSKQKTRVKHDWTFFFFLTIAFILVAAAIAWVSAKSGFFVTDQEDNESAYTERGP